jgi:hypothetical protein
VATGGEADATVLGDAVSAGSELGGDAESAGRSVGSKGEALGEPVVGPQAIATHATTTRHDGVRIRTVLTRGG